MALNNKYHPTYEQLTFLGVFYGFAFLLARIEIKLALGYLLTIIVGYFYLWYSNSNQDKGGQKG